MADSPFHAFSSRVSRTATSSSRQQTASRRGRRRGAALGAGLSRWHAARDAARSPKCRRLSSMPHAAGFIRRPAGPSRGAPPVGDAEMRRLAIRHRVGLRAGQQRSPMPFRDVRHALASLYLFALASDASTRQCLHLAPDIELIV